jgi:hypothetical protein
MQSTIRILGATMIAGLIAFPGCGEDDPLASADPYRPHEEGAVTVINGDPAMPIASGAVTEEGCLQVTADNCVPVVREGTFCKETEGPADAVVVDGMIAQVVCYSADPQKGTTTVLDGDGDGDTDIPQNENGAVITFDPSTDGKPVMGNITLDANNVTLYGNGPDKSIITGDLNITGNNARVRGIRVKGNVTISLNTAALIFVVVEGNLTVESNNSIVAETNVYGNFTVAPGNNTILVNNGAAGNWTIEPSGHQCDNNVALTDGDGDKTVDEGERGTTELVCPM